MNICAGCGCPTNKGLNYRWCKYCDKYVTWFKKWWDKNKSYLPLGRKCVDCGGKATGRDHRLYAKDAPTDLVCHACNHSRGAAKLPHEVVLQSRRLNKQPGGQLMNFDLTFLSEREKDKRRAAIIRLNQRGVPNAEIARKYGISRQRVSNIVHEARAKQ